MGLPLSVLDVIIIVLLRKRLFARDIGEVSQNALVFSVNLEAFPEFGALGAHSQLLTIFAGFEVVRFYLEFSYETARLI